MPRFEYYNTGDDSTYAVFGPDWAAQTFTAESSHVITSIKILVSRAYTNCGDVTVSIRNTIWDAGESAYAPTGADLAYGTVAQDDIPAWPTSEWVEFTLDTSVHIVSGTVYAIVVRAPNGAGGLSGDLRWSDDISSPTYSGGHFWYSPDSGSTWPTDAPGIDGMFEVWGAPTSASSKDSIFQINDGTDLQDISPYISNVDGLPGEHTLVEVSTLGGGGRTFMPVLEAPTITLDLHWSDDPSVGSDTVLGVLQDYGTAVAFDYGPEGKASGDVKYSGICWVRDFKVIARVGAQVIGRCELQVEGQVTRGVY